MSGVTIAWDEAVPPITEAAGLGYARIQSDKTSTRMGLDAEHQWPTAGGLAGYHRYGSARPFYGTQSRVSSDGTDARLMLTSDTSRLFATTSAGTVFVGGQNTISAFTAPSTLPQRHIWVESFGTGQTDASSIVTIVYPDSGFSGLPYVTISPTGGFGWTAPFAPDYTWTFPILARSRSTDFQVQGFNLVSTWSITASTGVIFTWRSLGSKAI